MSTEAASPAGGEQSARELSRHSSLISAATMLSRVLGLARDQLFATLLGASALTDAFVIAFRIPNLLRDLFAEGALSQAFVPVFKGQLHREGPASAYELANRVVGTLVAVTGFLALLGIVFAPGLVGVLAPGFKNTEGQFELTVQLTRIMLPFFPMISLAAIAMGVLNAQQKYGPPAVAPALFNVVSIATGLALYFAGVSQRTTVICWSIGTLLGGLAQLGVQIPSLYRIGYRAAFRLDLRLRDPKTRQIAKMMVPAIVGVAAVQVNVFVSSIFATREVGAATYLSNAFRFLQLPIGVFGMAIATVSATRYAESFARGDTQSTERQIREGLRLVFFLTIPATVGLIVLGDPIISMIYQHGQFGSGDAKMTAEALALYATGLVAYAAVKVIAPAFYAASMPRIATIGSLIAVAGNVIFSALLHPIFGFRVLALGTALAATLNFGVLYLGFHKRITRIAHKDLLVFGLKTGFAACVMGAVCYATLVGLMRWLPGLGFVRRIIHCMIPVTLGAGVYGLVCYALRIPELHNYTAKFSRLLARVRRNPKR